MTILAATIWAIGTLFMWGFGESASAGVGAPFRQKALMVVAAPLAWPLMLGVCFECRTRG